ncbi:MAG: TIGR03663 family protein [Candidatus Methanomethylicaceae archaeon]
MADSQKSTRFSPTESLEDAFLRRPLFTRITWEHLGYAIIFVLATISRLWDLGARVMSFDESVHAFGAYELIYKGGYVHTPSTHGPFIYHVTALSYFLFGDNDFSARLPIALIGIALVMLPLALRRWLGREGAMFTAVALLISPSILYYARYIRQEISILVWTLLTVLALWRYLKDPQPRWLVFFAVTLALHAADKATVFLLAGWLALFLLFILLWQWAKAKDGKRHSQYFSTFAGVSLGVALFAHFVFDQASMWLASAIGAPPIANDAVQADVQIAPAVSALAGLAVLTAGGLAWLYRRLFGDWMKQVSAQAPAFNALIVLVTTTMFMASPAILLLYDLVREKLSLAQEINVSLFEEFNINISKPRFVIAAYGMMFSLTTVAVAIGLAWSPSRWLAATAPFLLITLLLFTSFFTNFTGILTGFAGQLGYWITQHPVQRGNQPWYYYFVLASLYEYILMLGSLAAIGLLLKRFWHGLVKRTPGTVLRAHQFPLFVVWWMVVTWVIYSIAGEKMPWLVTHIALPMAVLSGWFAGQAVNHLTHAMPEPTRGRRGIMITVGASVSAVAALAYGIASAVHLDIAHPDALINIVQIAIALVVFLIAIIVLRRAAQRAAVTAFTLTTGLGLALLTIRTAVMAAFINADNVKEFLVYAHGHPSIRFVVEQIADLQKRVGHDKPLYIGFDGDAAWPTRWYLRSFPHIRDLGEQAPPFPGDHDVILISDYNVYFWGWVDSLRDRFVRFDYVKIWWPIEDYAELSWERIANTLFNASARKALWEIVFNRNFDTYAHVFRRRDLVLERWQPRMNAALFVRRQLIERALELVPPQKKQAQSKGAEWTQPMSPVAIALAPDGSRYVLDRFLSRVFHQDADGNLIRVWGEYGMLPGQFIFPWGIAIDDAGNVYIADTFNNRIQKFSADGKLMRIWDFEYTSKPLYGPRDIAVDKKGHLLIADTGNYRVLIVDRQDGLVIGELDIPEKQNELTGIAVDEQDGSIYILDTLNRRVLVFDQDYHFLRSWQVQAWAFYTRRQLWQEAYKPHLAVAQGIVYVASPISAEVFAFTRDGTARPDLHRSLPLQVLPIGIAAQGRFVYVADASSGAILRFEAHP